MDPAVWGPSCWRVAFATAFRLPATRCVSMLRALEHLLPCAHCRNSFKLHMSRVPPEAAIGDSSRAAAKYVWAVKDYVNTKLAAPALPFSTLCQRYETFGQPFSRMEVADLLCSVSMQVESDEQVRAYAEFAAVVQDLVKAYGERMDLMLPLDAKYSSPPTLWLHALRCKNAMCTELGAPQLTRDDMLARYRTSEAPKTKGAVSAAASRSARPSRGMPQRVPRAMRTRSKGQTRGVSRAL